MEIDRHTHSQTHTLLSHASSVGMGEKCVGTRIIRNIQKSHSLTLYRILSRDITLWAGLCDYWIYSIGQQQQPYQKQKKPPEVTSARSQQWIDREAGEIQVSTSVMEWMVRTKPWQLVLKSHPWQTQSLTMTAIHIDNNKKHTLQTYVTTCRSLLNAPTIKNNYNNEVTPTKYTICLARNCFI